MKKLLSIILLACASLCVTPALANPPTDQPPGCEESGGQPQKCDGTVNNGGGGGSVGDIDSHNQQQQGQQQGQIQGQLQGQQQTAEGGAGGAGGSAVATASGGAGGAGGNGYGGQASNAGVKTVVDASTRFARNAPSLSGPTVNVSQCQKSLSGGITTPLGGFVLGGSSRDKQCEWRWAIDRLETWGMIPTACQLLALDPKVNLAMQRTGKGCPAY